MANFMNRYTLESMAIATRVKLLPKVEVSSKWGEKVFYEPLDYDLIGIALDQATLYSQSLKVIGFETKVEEGANLMIDSGTTGTVSFLARRTNEEKDIVRRFAEDKKRKEDVEEKEGFIFNTRIIRYTEIPRVNVYFNYFYFSPNSRAEALRMLLGINKE